MSNSKRSITAWCRLVERRNKEGGVAGTKFELPDEFFKAQAGSILLQDHGARVGFRSVRIHRLDKDGPSDTTKAAISGQ